MPVTSYLPCTDTLLVVSLVFLAQAATGLTLAKPPPLPSAFALLSADPELMAVKLLRITGSAAVLTILTSAFPVLLVLAILVPLATTPAMVRPQTSELAVVVLSAPRVKSVRPTTLSSAA